MTQTLTPPIRTSSPPKLEFKVRDLSLAEWGRKEIMLAEQEMPGLMAVREEYAQAAAAEGAEDRRLAAHDDPDGGADRDAGGAGRGGALVLVQHLQHAGPRRRGGRGRPAGDGGTVENPKGVPVFAWKGETLEEYWWCTERALDFGNGAGPDQIVDDGGDVTLLIHKGTEFEAAGKVPGPGDDRQRGVQGHPRAARQDAQGNAAALDERRQERARASAKKRPPACIASTKCRRPASCCSPRSTSTTASPRASSTTSTAAATR